MFVGDDACSDVCLNEAIDDEAAAEHHTMVRLPGNEEGQAAVVTVCISGADKLCGDDYLLSFCTAENRFQTSHQYRDLVIDGVHLEITLSQLL